MMTYEDVVEAVDALRASPVKGPILIELNADMVARVFAIKRESLADWRRRRDDLRSEFVRRRGRARKKRRGWR